MQRVQFLAAASLSAALPFAARAAEGDLASLERRSGGKLGVFAFVPGGSRAPLAHREAARFPMCSTFKALAVAAILARVDAGSERLDRQVVVRPGDLLEYAPVARVAVARGKTMSIAQLCAAAITFSDNTAANLLLAALGGPPAVTRFARSIGDHVTRLDRIEPDLNTAIAGDPRDTTTPRAMAYTLSRLVLGHALSPRSRAQLRAWLIACATGGARLRAGIPAHWRTGDKTGTGEHGTSNDIAVAWPSGGSPIVICAFLTQATCSAAQRDAIIAAVARLSVAALT